MFEGLEIRVPAMRGKMGSRTYYGVLMPMSGVPQFFRFTNWTGISPDDREQRVLNEKRVPDLAGYITENEEDYIFSSITASYKGEPKFEPFSEGSNIGALILQLGDEFIINDGQHILYDKRDDLAAATLSMIDELPVFKELTDNENISLGVKSTKLFTLAALYDANAELLKGREKEPTEANVPFLVDYWSALAEHMPDWTKVMKGQQLALELRQEKISSHSTVLRALGGVGLELMHSPNWKSQLAALEDIDWRKKNPEWQGVCISSKSVASNRQARAATKAFIKAKLGLALTDGERKTLPAAATALVAAAA